MKGFRILSGLEFYECFLYCSEHYGAAGAVRAPGKHRDLDMRGAGAILPWHATSSRRGLVPLRPSCLYTGTAATYGELLRKTSYTKAVSGDIHIPFKQNIDTRKSSLYCCILYSSFVFIHYLSFLTIFFPSPFLSVFNSLHFPFNPLPLLCPFVSYVGQDRELLLIQFE